MIAPFRVSGLGDGLQKNIQFNDVLKTNLIHPGIIDTTERTEPVLQNGSPTPGNGSMVFYPPPFIPG
ncbi:MAG: hypothetical protein D6677_09770 [Calditrichaeota bacterium]|nr:MAG: hypothetical protein D6677_09770 [Calditrichota bacterium]